MKVQERKETRGNDVRKGKEKKKEKANYESQIGPKAGTPRLSIE